MKITGKLKKTILLGVIAIALATSFAISGAGVINNNKENTVAFQPFSIDPPQN